MPAIFISYARQSAAMATTLAGDMKMFGYEVWFDQELSGGQAWWNHILTWIRGCDIFVFLLTPDALDSTACMRECNYAAALGKPILPILVTDGISIPRLPPILSQIHFVDSRRLDRASLSQLFLALKNAPPPGPEPTPLPTPPAVPMSYLGTLAEQIGSETSLTYAQQSALVVDLRQAARESTTAEDAYQLLQQLRQRRDLLATTAREIDEFLAGLKPVDGLPGPIPTIVRLFKSAVAWVLQSLDRSVATSNSCPGTIFGDS